MSSIVEQDGQKQLDNYVKQQLRFIEDSEKQELEEVEQRVKTLSPGTLQNNGLALLNMRIASGRTGLGGKMILELERDAGFCSIPALPAHSFGTGDVVRIQESGASKSLNSADSSISWDAVVVRVRENTISLALENDDKIPDGRKRLWIFKLANRVTFEKMRSCIQQLSKISLESSTPLVSVLLGMRKSTLASEELALTYYNTDLNESQKKAVSFAVSAPELALIHGPPGTGKTHTLVEVVRQFAKLGQRVLVCGPSNLSVDNLVERLAPCGIPMVRLGHPARLLPGVVNYSLAYLSRTGNAGEVLRAISQDADALHAKISKTKSGREKREIYKSIRALNKDYKKYEDKVVRDIIARSQVVFATLHGAGSKLLSHKQFDVVIIDEASQALEAQCWIPLLQTKKAILAGDHHQLPPNVRTKGRYVSLFESLLSRYGPRVKRFLNVQYRMHEVISAFSSKSFYEGQLKPDSSVKDRLLKDLSGVEDTDLTNDALYFYDTMHEYFEDENSVSEKSVLLQMSKSNQWEAKIVCNHAASLVDAGLNPSEIAIITPYNAQATLLRNLLHERNLAIEVGSIDSVQGREKEAIIFSLVRSNDEREIGFMSEKRRLNVAITRAKRHLCVVGDAMTVRNGSDFLKSWIDYMEENAIVLAPTEDDLK
ncbi:DNA polymerase alpha-associated DNA helicase A [Schizosaccharomyces japonicus yFS275]|uniref:DNA helicase n=1 Tax=Schizosaccharomyces japonicus (strain yFS275 / FY16936) TaxID=402676 RepID=B6K4D9_SCHJY|nr:DNA polymerase alpha-associated DNA helicase A [Schizosaccharomyces japonicus yFS275]EEB08346.1 DNA polymerase alpha-associated DNA helicase A [Schizosaccharomyces japonicus yFS275]